MEYVKDVWYMIEIKNKINCCGCGACETICPKNCIILCMDKNGFYYPRLKKEDCIECGACERVCPVINLPPRKKSIKKMFACSSNDLYSKSHSSSGGMFYLLASYILMNKGVVFGVKLSDDCRTAFFTYVKSNEMLYSLLGSKYIQAHTKQIYTNVRNELKRGIPVLFSGTPCHVAALKNFLKKEYSNLYLVDISCHGVPSEKAWNRYLDFREKCEGAKVVSASFRSKESGWRDFSVSTNFSNGSHYAEIFIKDSFGKAFTERLLFRPSCEHCKFKGVNRWSDITLADFWGIDEIIDAFNDDEGTSLVIVHSEKGLHILNAIKEFSKMVPITQEQGTRRNPYIYRSVVPHSNKKKFFDALDDDSFDSLVEQYATKEFVIQDFIFDLKRYIKRKTKRGRSVKL